LRGHRTVFTHGDLQPKNIIVQKTGGSGEGKTGLKVVIIDWETSGWYPYYWEFCNSMISARLRPDWLEVVQHVLAPYAQEYWKLEGIRHLLFY